MIHINLLDHCKAGAGVNPLATRKASNGSFVSVQLSPTWAPSCTLLNSKSTIGVTLELSSRLDFELVRVGHPFTFGSPYNQLPSKTVDIVVGGLY